MSKSNKNKNKNKYVRRQEIDDEKSRQDNKKYKVLKRKLKESGDE